MKASVDSPIVLLGWADKCPSLLRQRHLLGSLKILAGRLADTMLKATRSETDAAAIPKGHPPRFVGTPILLGFHVEA